MNSQPQEHAPVSPPDPERPSTVSLPDATIDLLHLAEFNSDGIAVLDSAGHYLFVNREAERILGTTREALLGQSVWDVFPDASTAADFRAHFDGAVTRHEAGSYDVFWPKISRHLQVRLVPCSGHQTVSGDERGVSVYFRDVTEQLLAERSQSESEARFRILADAAPVLIWMSGPDSLCDWFNKPWLDFTGRTMAQERGNGWAEGVHADDFDRCLTTYLRAFEDREPFTMEYRLRRHDGEWRWLLDNGVPRYDPSGAFVGFIGSCIDITERRAAEEASNALARELAARVAQQRAFLKDVLLAVTDGVLILCDSLTDLPTPVSPSGTLDDFVALPLSGAAALRPLRRETERVASDCGLREDRISDLLTAASEAAMNVVTHAKGHGRGQVVADSENGTVQVWITDRGPGIPLDRLHRAVLERGFTTGNSLGHGFFLMLQTSDRIYLLTGEEGTTVLIEKRRIARTPEWAER